MSETLTNPNLDLDQVNAAQAAHEAGFIESGQPDGSLVGQAIPAVEAGSVTTHGEQAAATTATQELPAPVEPVAELLNPNRALARLGDRLSRFASRLSGTAERRTAKQVVAEKKSAAVDHINEKAEAAKASAKQVATKVGVAAVLSVDSALEGGIRVSKYAAEKKSSVKEFISEKRDAAQARKESRVNARANARADRAESRMRDEANRMNYKFDARARRAETRQELSEKAKATAKFVGKAALVTGIVAGYGAYKAGEAGVKLDRKTAEFATKGVRKTIEVAADVSEATKVKVTRGKQVAQESIRKTVGKAETRAAHALIAHHENQMRKHTRKAEKHQAKIPTGRHA